MNRFSNSMQQAEGEDIRSSYDNLRMESEINKNDFE